MPSSLSEITALIRSKNPLTTSSWISTRDGASLDFRYMKQGKKLKKWQERQDQVSDSEHYLLLSCLFKLIVSSGYFSLKMITIYILDIQRYLILILTLQLFKAI